MRWRLVISTDGENKMSDMTTPPETPPAPPPKRVKPRSRPQRWADAAEEAAAALSQIESGLADFQSAMEELDSVRQEYEEWKDNLPENLAQSALGEKLEEV